MKFKFSPLLCDGIWICVKKILFHSSFQRFFMLFYFVHSLHKKSRSTPTLNWFTSWTWLFLQLLKNGGVGRCERMNDDDLSNRYRFVVPSLWNVRKRLKREWRENEKAQKVISKKRWELEKVFLSFFSLRVFLSLFIRIVGAEWNFCEQHGTHGLFICSSSGGKKEYVRLPLNSTTDKWNIHAESFSHFSRFWE